ncbi:hypothetical protein PoB_000289000 [Plakobranchus ocellatus]|uniref:Uncharacterized protein n=1 Tax=Plakobranchus ocellatus TaxID=259542 RepID=A0AAV3XZX4_9GAST|nr:hypothetical protein PoB_000289000 [Plakobranchus ocellatus]
MEDFNAHEGSPRKEDNGPRVLRRHERKLKERTRWCQTLQGEKANPAPEDWRSPALPAPPRHSAATTTVHPAACPDLFDRPGTVMAVMKLGQRSCIHSLIHWFAHAGEIE